MKKESRLPLPSKAAKRSAEAKPSAPPKLTGPVAHRGCTIVGLGASAGGLEALEGFLRNVPPQSGLAFVVVQHLDPTHEGMLPALLQRGTAMKVVQVKDPTPVSPDCVYVIPPNKDMSVLRGVLHLFEPSAPRGLRLPIDFFFRSLAADQGERSVGVILSGMGTDGTAGLRAIKEQAGLALVQDPSSAKFNGMPCSAIDAKLADIVAPVEDLPGRLFAYLGSRPLFALGAAAADPGTEGQIEKIFILLRGQTKHDFSLYKRSTIQRRIERRMGLHQITKLGAYLNYLRETPHEIESLFKDLLIGVTSFFRDPASWDQLRDKILPELFANYPAGATLRAWVPGCSSGEEAYTLAMVFMEALSAVGATGKFSLQIFATDLDREAVDTARQAYFPSSIVADVSAERLQRYFHAEARGYRMTKEIREMVVFAPQNLTLDPPFTKLDLLICRNVLIYFTTELQQRLFPLFHYSLNPGGVLFLGNAESIGSFTDLFTPFDGRLHFYRRLGSGGRERVLEFPSAFVAPRRTTLVAANRTEALPPSLRTLAEQWLLQTQTPAAVLCNASGDILFISGRTGRYLEPAAGAANWNVFVMAREGLRGGLIGAFQQAQHQKVPVVLRDLRPAPEDGGPGVELTVQFLEKPDSLRGLAMIVFTNVPAPIPAGKDPDGKHEPTHPGLDMLTQELKLAREEAQATREAMQATQEELKSMNEELQSANEELQSTNEELTTSKEEMQSLNEELQTVNSELRSKLGELASASDDMKNLLNSTAIATLFLDHGLGVRRFTETATKIIKLIPGDVGRPVTDLATDLLYPELAADAREVLRTLVPVPYLSVWIAHASLRHHIAFDFYRELQRASQLRIVRISAVIDGLDVFVAKHAIGAAEVCLDDACGGIRLRKCPPIAHPELQASTRPGRRSNVAWLPDIDPHSLDALDT